MGTTSNVAVIGAGSWGTALARLLARQGIATALWARETEVVDSVATHRENSLFLPGIELPADLRVTNDLAEALTGAAVIVSAVPTQHVRAVFDEARDLFDGAEVLVSVSKGIEVETLETPSQILREVAPPRLAGGVVALSGPSFARDVALDHPTAVVAACESIERAREVRDLFNTSTFRVYSSDDIVSAELGGALKNVIALAAGMSYGLGFAQNSMAALLTRGLAEIRRVGVAMGGRPETFAGLTGMGDLVLTCSGELSRNRRVGLEIGRGRTLTEILSEMQMVAEGVKTTLAARQLAEKLGVSMPITEEVYLVLYEEKDPRDALAVLMGRAPRDERDD
jgi:glycerol-3-phosphate dehydrogenase (NAD(P)+)